MPDLGRCLRGGTQGMCLVDTVAPMKILGIHDGSGCAWYRVLMPLLEMRKHGYVTEFCTASNKLTPWDDPDQNNRRAVNFSGYDLIVGQRLAKYSAVDTWRRGRTPFTRLVYENDDDVFTITPDNWIAYQFFEKAEVQEAVIANTEVSDLVTVTSKRLAEIHGEYNPNVLILPNLIPAYVLKMKRAERGRPRIGWVGGASHGRDVHLATPSVRRFMKRFPHWDLYLGGTDLRPSFKVPRARAFHEPWIAITLDPEAYYQSIDFDIGICPLLDTPFARSKSYIKALEYMARGIPVVASDFGPYREIIRHGENGFLAGKDHEWLSALSDLASDEGLRQKIGEAGKETAKNHTIDEHWRRWADAYGKLYPSTWTFGRNT